MEDTSKLSNMNTFGFIGKQSLVPQKNIWKNNSPPSSIHHYSASLDDILIEEQPPWLDELLSEPASPKMNNKGYRRSSSDTSAYLNSVLVPFKEDDLVHSHFAGPSWQFQNVNHNDDLWQSKSYVKGKRMGWEHSNTNKTHLQRHASCGAINILNTSESKPAEKEISKLKEGAATKTDGHLSKTDSKRIKHQNAHRARLRRLEYISDLERTIQVLQAHGCEMSSAIHYLDQQLIMLSMENRNLKQRLDSLAEIQKLKHMEQKFLEREIGNLQFPQYHKQPQQKQKHMQESPRDVCSLE